MPHRIAYVAAEFPLRSETFVHREVSWLRAHGWTVRTVSLNHPREAESPELADLRRDRIVVYGSRRVAGLWSALMSAVAEWLRHPLRATATLATAMGDAIAPAEKLSLAGRIKLLAQALAGLSLSRKLRGDAVSYIHCHFAHAPASVGMYAAMQLGIGFGFTGHANDLFQRRQLLRRKLSRARLVVCISHWHRELYRSIAEERPAYRVIRCGVDEVGWRPAAVELCENATPTLTLPLSTRGGEKTDSLPLSAGRGDTTGPLRVLSVCRLVEKKGIDTLVRAVGILVHGGRAVELTVAGDGPDRNRLASIAGESGCRTSLAWLGAVDHDRVRELLAAADIFVLPCRTDRNGDRDGIPVALMEAMACGVASIAGNLPAIAELIENGRSGMLVDGTNAEQLAGRIAELADDAELRRRLGAAGRKRVIEEFSTEPNMAKMCDAIEEAIGEAAAVAGGDAPIAADQSQSRRYCLITPCRDEEKFARRTLDSVTKQTAPPSLWVIVDDGSTDSTPAILAEYAAKYPYIRVMRREDRGFRKLGGGVIDAFYFGYDAIDPQQFDYVCKLDLDLEFPRDYFANLMDRMEKQPRLGALSGKPYYNDPATGQPVREMCGDEHCVGMVKFYRRQCFAEIGGFVRELMWDGIDGHRCRMLGWMSASVDDQAIRFVHLRPMGTSHKGWWTGRVRHGVGQYFMGTGVSYIVASAIGRLGHPPIIVGSAAHLWGYFKSMIQRKPRYGDAEFRRFLNRYQWACLLRGKQRATLNCDAAGDAVWRKAHRPGARPAKASNPAQT